MKKISTLIMTCLFALAAQAQTSDFPLQFADKHGNIIADGTELLLTQVEDNGFNILLPSGLFVKNISDADVQAGGFYEILSISNGAFQTCFPQNCIYQDHRGSYETTTGNIAAGALKDMETEWIPDDAGTVEATYQLVTYKQNSITKKWNVSARGPKISLNFSYNPAAVSSIGADKAVRSVSYYDLHGQHISQPGTGLYIRKVLYADGTTATQKLLMR